MINNIQELLQKYFNESEHYLAPATIEHINTYIDGDGIVYSIRVDSPCDATGFEEIGIMQNDLLVWLYNEKN